MMLTIYHNPRCSKSRATLKILEGAGEKPLIIDYMDKPPSVSELQGVLKMLGMNAYALLRKNEQEAKDLGLNQDTPQEQILEAMTKHPRLIERPIVLNMKGARVCRPPETVYELIESAA